MKEQNKPKYNLWQNTVFMIKTAGKKYRSVPILCVVLAFLCAAQTAVELLIAPAILTQIETNAPLPHLIYVIGIFVGLLMLLSAFKIYTEKNTFFGRISVRQEINRSLAQKSGETSYENLLDTRFLNTGEKALHASNKNSEATEAIWTTWTNLLTNLFGFCIYLIFLSNLSLWLMGVVCLTTFLSYLIGNKVNEWGYRHKEEDAAYSKKLTLLCSYCVDRKYAKDIRIFGLGNWIQSLWNSTQCLYQGFIEKREKVYILTNLADLIMNFLRNGIAYAYLLSITIKNNLPASQFLLYFGAVSGFSLWISGILKEFATLHKQSLDLCVVREFLEWEDPFHLEGGESINKNSYQDYELRLDNVSYRYPESNKYTIQNMNLTIHPGEKLAIVGLNGAGKTTLIKLLCGFLNPTEGKVLLNGKDIRDYNRWDYYSLFSSVFQDFSVLDNTIAENIAQTDQNIDEARIWECIDKAGLREKIESLPQKLQTHIGRQIFDDGMELSGGQTQRLMLARALYKDAPILMLDEPTAALDPIAENDIYSKYNEMTKGKTSVFISHRLASTRFCDRILFLKHGKIAEEGTHEQLLQANGSYAKLFNVQSQYYK